MLHLTFYTSEDGEKKLIRDYQQNPMEELREKKLYVGFNYSGWGGRAF